MIETASLTIKEKGLAEIPMEESYRAIYPELKDLDPAVGVCMNPVYFSIFLKDDMFIGTSCFYNWSDTEVEFGVTILIPHYWSKGYGTEITNALCDYAFSEYPHLTRILVKTPLTNTRARRCYEKCGFEPYKEVVMGAYWMLYMIRRRGES